VRRRSAVVVAAPPIRTRSIPAKATKGLSPVLGREDDVVADDEDDVVAAGVVVLVLVDAADVAAVPTTKSLNPNGIGVAVLPPSLAVTPT
jgi:hypothetical protein